jgi:hypothetical protein
VLVVRDAVQLANQLIDFPVGGGDFAVQSWSGEVLIGGGGGVRSFEIDDGELRPFGPSRSIMSGWARAGPPQPGRLHGFR